VSAGRPLIVAIDGPAGVGKSTVARLLARRLGVPYLETGAMYRAVAHQVLARGVSPADQAAVEALAGSVDVRLDAPGPGGDVAVLLEGEPVGDRIRTPEVAAATSAVAAYPAVRRRLVALQRQGAERWGGVVEGRDIGTRVVPEAPFKFFLEARPEVRFRRRYEELRRSGRPVRLEEVEEEMSRRDHRDSHRADSPLRRNASYVALDTSERTPEEVVGEMLAVIRGQR
jgi:cytidylate kinase